MASFLDNSCDIILDTVLTDYGRQLLAKGDGSFKITKFALSDEEIDYGLFDKNHASGSAYYDLEILQTPILEAITDNATSMKTKLISYDNNNLLYLPILKLNKNDSATKTHADTDQFLVAVDRLTEGTTDGCTDNAVGFNGTDRVTGVLFGESIGGAAAGGTSGGYIRVDQGINSTEISARQNMDPDLVEDVYLCQMDNRFGSMTTVDGTVLAPDFVDDDNIAHYSIGRGDGAVIDNTDITNSATQTISGPRGTILQFKIQSSIHLNTSNFLYTKLGGITSMTNKAGSSQQVRFIDTQIKVTGLKTGYSIYVPVRFVKTIN